MSITITKRLFPSLLLPLSQKPSLCLKTENQEFQLCGRYFQISKLLDIQTLFGISETKLCENSTFQTLSNKHNVPIITLTTDSTSEGSSCDVSIQCFKPNPCLVDTHYQLHNLYFTLHSDIELPSIFYVLNHRGKFIYLVQESETTHLKMESLGKNGIISGKLLSLLEKPPLQQADSVETDNNETALKRKIND